MLGSSVIVVNQGKVGLRTWISGKPKFHVEACKQGKRDDQNLNLPLLTTFGVTIALLCGVVKKVYYRVWR